MPFAGHIFGSYSKNTEFSILSYVLHAVVYLVSVVFKIFFFLQIIASASASNGLVQSKICLWDTSTRLCRSTLKYHDYDVIDLAYSRDDR